MVSFTRVRDNPPYRENFAPLAESKLIFLQGGSFPRRGKLIFFSYMVFYFAGLFLSYIGLKSEYKRPPLRCVEFVPADKN